MDRHLAKLNALLAGFGSAFALFPTGALDHYLKRESVESRVYGNFARVGAHLDSAMQKVRDEQKEQSEHAG